MALHKAICSAVAATLGFHLDWTFNPHVTLAHTPRLDQRTIEPIRWTVRKFALVHSDQGEGRHNILGSWRLGD